MEFNTLQSIATVIAGIFVTVFTIVIPYKQWKLLKLRVKQNYAIIEQLIQINSILMIKNKLIPKPKK